MSRAVVVIALATVFLVAGTAEAARGGEHDKPEKWTEKDLPAKAKAKGLEERAPAVEEPAKAPATETHRASRASRADDRAPVAPASIVPTPAARADRADVMFAAMGSASVAAPRLPGVGTPSSSADAGGAPWWLALLWAVPLVGVGGAGTVILLRRRQATAPVVVPGEGGPRIAPADPEDVSTLLKNGRAAVVRGRVDEAVAWFDAALRVVPTLAVAHFCKGVCLAANGRVAEAYGALDEAVYAAPDEAAYRVHFARVAVALGRPHDAMDALATVAREMPELGPAMLEDPQLAGLRDHPRFLMMCGAL